jgi:hypothetical protein
MILSEVESQYFLQLPIFHKLCDKLKSIFDRLIYHFSYLWRIRECVMYVIISFF